MCQVLESSLYTDAAVLYCAQIVMAGTDLNEVSCCPVNQPGEEEEPSLAMRGGGGGGGCDTTDYISTPTQMENKPDTVRSEDSTYSNLRTDY